MSVIVQQDGGMCFFAYAAGDPDENKGLRLGSVVYVRISVRDAAEIAAELTKWLTNVAAQGGKP